MILPAYHVPGEKEPRDIDLSRLTITATPLPNVPGVAVFVLGELPEGIELRVGARVLLPRGTAVVEDVTVRGGLAGTITTVRVRLLA